MTILLKNINGTDLIKYQPDYYNVVEITGGINCTLLFLGILFETLVIVSILRVRQKTVDTLFVLSLCCADMIFNVCALPLAMIVMISSGWATGRIGCLISAGATIATLAISILSITLITLNRYLAIIMKTNITRSQALLMITLAWVVVFTVVGLYASNKNLLEQSFALQPSYTYCLLDFAATDPIVITAIFTIFIFLSIPSIFMIYAYSTIIIFYRKMNRSREFVTPEVSSIWRRV